ncbi:zinc carboxypeptidase-related protein [Shewanella sediminis HAW-EB3]|uniref:Zinc carboxypeptidase-related protein n=1 Tax=Shewanella sediminis (strain HAW-EB3) TaxID=425104 RepID=A8FVY7_SHESH|nr:M14 family metallocarboxypeptidase [Shewanella sediminis]ABV37010.1 zinc carboxypeptidase-related protein [Shewanella sediminis HAW-EB3]
MKQSDTYSIGIPGNKWGEEEKKQWLLQQEVKRSYQKEVVAKLEPLKARFDVEQYGELSYDAGTYPLFVVRSRQWDSNKATILVTGGVHGYETSGVQGAIRFLETKAESYSDQFNIIVAPCLSPWGYETINRWNPSAVDPNRSFYEDSPSQESAALMRYIATFQLKLTAHIDLHETTDTDNSEFRPALAARDGSVHNNWNIPDGFYLVGDTENPVDEFQKAIIEVVAQVTHIAPPDGEGKLIGVPLSQEGVVNYATKALGLCIGFSDAAFTTTTEVYPDSPLVDDENCILAQVAAITGGLDFILKRG